MGGPTRNFGGGSLTLATALSTVNAGHPLFFRARLLNVNSIFNTVKNSRATLFFQGKRKLLKKSECKKYIPYSGKFQGNSAFQGKRKNRER